MTPALLMASLPVLLQLAASQPPAAAAPEEPARQASSGLPPPAASPAPAPVPAPASPLARGSDIGYFTAGNLADRCASSDGISYCFAYIAAVHDTMRAYEVWLDQKEFCPPAALAQGDLRRSFLTYMSAYPGNRSGQAASVIVVALKQTYPCIDRPPETPPQPAAQP